MKRQILLSLALLSFTAFAQAQTTTKPTGALPVTSNIFRVPTTDSLYMYIQGVNKYYGVARVSDLFKKVDKVVGFGLSSNDYTGAEKSKLAGIQNLATANQTDAYLLSRANHTGVQPQSSITNLVTDLAGKANDNNVVHLTGTESLTGRKTFGAGLVSVGEVIFNPASGSALSVNSYNPGTGNRMALNFQGSSSFTTLYGNPSSTASYVELPSNSGILALKSDIPSLTGYALDANVVHRAGNIAETITGEKTFSSDLKGGFANFSTYLSVGNGTSNVALTTGDIKYNVGSNLLSVYPLTLTASRVQRYQNDDGTIALTKNYAAGQTIGANTTGNAATATTAGSASIWSGQSYGGAIAANTLNLFMVYSNTDNQWHYATPAQIKTNLSTTLQDVTTANGTVSGNNAYPIVINRTVANGGYLGIRYDDNTTYKWFQGFRELGNADLHLYNASIDNSHVVYKANGNTLFGGGTDNGAYKVQITGSLSATGDIGINGNISAANLAASNYTAATVGATNIISLGNGTNFYSRVGNVVTVSGSVTATNNATGASSFSVQIPVPSNFTTSADASGTAWTENSNGGFVFANVGSQYVSIYIGNHSNNASKRYSFTFQYIVK